MASPNDWPLLREAFNQLPAKALRAAYEIICRGDVPVAAVRSDIVDSDTPERVEALLAKATSAFVLSENEITADFDSRQDRAIFGLRSTFASKILYPQWETLRIVFSTARVHWPSLVAALAAAGFDISQSPPPPAPTGARSQQPQKRGAYKGELAAFMKRMKPEMLSALSDDNIALRFRDHVEAQRKAGRSALNLPQRRHIANQVAKLRPQAPSKA
jgi:hypothetical protein